MPETLDFERAWLAKFASCLGEIAGEEIRKEVMRGSEALSSHSGRQEVIDWSKIAMERLDSLLDEKRRRAVMAGCSCQYPKADLQEMRKTYQATGPESISATHCYCGAGFYKGIWEEILQAPVEVEVLESVLKGDEVCTIAIHLPVDQ
jgi:predicted hydrocarbon binding protein